MNHVDLLKRAFQITWRYRPLWLFGFILALCGGGGGGGGGNFNFPGGSGEEFGNLEGFPNLPSINPATIMAVVAVVILLVLVLSVAAVVLRMVTRTALIGMVRQIEENGAVAVSDGWRIGWSRAAWRLFLVSLVIGIPLAIIGTFLFLLALSPLLLLIAEETALTVTGIVLTVIAVIIVLLIFLAAGAVIVPFQELAWRQTVLDRQGVIASLRGAIALVRQQFKDVAIIWLLMLGVGFGWGVVALVVVLPVSLIAAVLAGGIPAGLVYLISRSGVGAAVAGIPLAVIALVLVSSAATAFYLIFRSAVWTLAYLHLEPPPAADALLPEPAPQAE